MRIQADAFEEGLKARGLEYSDPELQAYLESVASLLAAQAPAGPFPYRITVLRDPVLATFVLPNGTIYLSGGLLARVDDEAQLALVIAHPLNHLALDHPAKAFSGRRANAVATDLTSMTLGPYSLLKDLPPAGIAAAVDAQSRALEVEADRGGMEWLGRAGFASEQAPALFAFYAEGRDPRPRLNLYDDPPGNPERQSQCASLVASGAVPANPHGRNDVAALRRAVAGLTLESVRLQVASGQYELALAEADRAAQRYGESAPLHFYQGRSLLMLQRSFDRAQMHMRRALELDPGYRTARRGLGEVLLAQGDPAAAEAVFEEYLRANPGAPDAGIVEALLREEPRASRGEHPAVTAPGAWWALAVLVAGLCAYAGAADRHLSPVRVRLGGVKKVAIMPVEGEIRLVQFLSDDEPGVEETQAAAAEILKMELLILQSRHFDAESLALGETVFAQKPELRFQVTQVQKNAQTAMMALHSGDRIAAEAAIRGSLDELHQFAALVGADAVLFTRLDGFRRSGFGRVVFFLPRSSTTVEVCLVDANSGEVLFIDSSTRSIDPPWRVTELAMEAFERSP